jgi:hypothetical protein
METTTPVLKKSQSLLLLLMTLLAPRLIYAQTTNGPNLAETLIWMQNFAKAHSYWATEKSKDNPNGVDSTRLSFNKCEVVQTLFDGFKSLGDTRYSLADIDPQTIKSDKLKGSEGGVSFETTNSQDLIGINVPVAWGGSIQEYCKHQTCTSSWRINFDTEENAKRFATAFRNAVSLCGGKHSTF